MCKIYKKPIDDLLIASKREISQKIVDNRKNGGYNKAITNDYELGGNDLPRLFNTTPPQKRAKGEIYSRLLLFLFAEKAELSGYDILRTAV